MDHAITVTSTSPFTLGLVFIFSAQNYDFIKETEHIYYISKGSYKTRVAIYTKTFSLMRFLGNLLLSSPKLRLVCKSLCKNTSDLTMYLISYFIRMFNNWFIPYLRQKEESKHSNSGFQSFIKVSFVPEVCSWEIKRYTNYSSPHPVSILHVPDPFELRQ